MRRCCTACRGLHLKYNIPHYIKEFSEGPINFKLGYSRNKIRIDTVEGGEIMQMVKLCRKVSQVWTVCPASDCSALMKLSSDGTVPSSFGLVMRWDSSSHHPNNAPNSLPLNTFHWPLERNGKYFRSHFWRNKRLWDEDPLEPFWRSGFRMRAQSENTFVPKAACQIWFESTRYSWREGI